MKTIDLMTAVVRLVVAIALIVLLIAGAFKSDAGTILATFVALTTTTAATQSIVHAKTCEGHGKDES